MTEVAYTGRIAAAKPLPHPILIPSRGCMRHSVGLTLLIVCCIAVVANAQQGQAPSKDKKDDGPTRLIQELKTEQGQTVTLTTEHDPWADRVVSYTPGKPAPKT